jgi:hypothetical protein
VATQCGSQARGVVARITLLDECGAPVEGACSTVVTDGFISVEAAKNQLDAQEIEVVTASGALCATDPGCPQFKNWDLSIEFCRVDPSLFSIVTGSPTITDYAGKIVGFRTQAVTRCSAFALEVWSDVLGQACSGAGQKLYGYWLYPFVVGGLLGDHTFENDGLTFTVEGFTKSGTSWDVGPYDVIATDALNTPGPLDDPLSAVDHLHSQFTTIAPPTPGCGCTSLILPS